MNQKQSFRTILTLFVIILVAAVVYAAVYERKTALAPSPTPAPTSNEVPIGILPVSDPILDTPIPESLATQTKASPIPAPKPKNGMIPIFLGKEFMLREGQVATIAESGFEVEILKFFNDPCPPNANCFWSGVGISFEYRLKGQVKQGINLTKAFGYTTEIISTDHETYANLIVTR